jgi:hypothetical protein
MGLPPMRDLMGTSLTLSDPSGGRFSIPDRSQRRPAPGRREAVPSMSGRAPGTRSGSPRRALVALTKLSIPISESSPDLRTPPRLVGPPLLYPFRPRQAIDEPLGSPALISWMSRWRGRPMANTVALASCSTKGGQPMNPSTLGWRRVTSPRNRGRSYGKVFSNGGRDGHHYKSLLE